MPTLAAIGRLCCQRGVEHYRIRVEEDELVRATLDVFRIAGILSGTSAKVSLLFRAV